MLIKFGELFLRWSVTDDSELAKMEEIILKAFEETFPDIPCTLISDLVEREV